MNRLKNILRNPNDIHSLLWQNANMTTEPLDIMKAIRGIEGVNPEYLETDNSNFEETKTPRDMPTKINDRTNILDRLRKEYY